MQSAHPLFWAYGLGNYYQNVGFFFPKAFRWG